MDRYPLPVNPSAPLVEDNWRWASIPLDRHKTSSFFTAMDKPETRNVYANQFYFKSAQAQGVKTWQLNTSELPGYLHIRDDQADLERGYKKNIALRLLTQAAIVKQLECWDLRPPLHEVQ